MFAVTSPGGPSDLRSFLSSDAASNGWRSLREGGATVFVIQFVERARQTPLDVQSAADVGQKVRVIEVLECVTQACLDVQRCSEVVEERVVVLGQTVALGHRSPSSSLSVFLTIS